MSARQSELTAGPLAPLIVFLVACLSVCKRNLN